MRGQARSLYSRDSAQICHGTEILRCTLLALQLMLLSPEESPCSVGVRQFTLPHRGTREKRSWSWYEKDQEQFLSLMTNVEKSEGGSDPIQCLPRVFYNRLVISRETRVSTGGRQRDKATYRRWRIWKEAYSVPLLSGLWPWASSFPLLALKKKSYFNTANLAGDALLPEC